MRKVQHKVKLLIKQITKDINEETDLTLTEEEVYNMILNQFETIKDKLDGFNIDNEDTHNIRIQLNYLGTFTINKRAIWYEKDKIKKKRDTTTKTTK